VAKALSEQSAVKYHARKFLFDLNEGAMWEIIRAGGGFMWPIILCSIRVIWLKKSGIGLKRTK
jgi:hypothetical protein